jgi:hypothetical protein
MPMPGKVLFSSSLYTVRDFDEKRIWIENHLGEGLPMLKSEMRAEIFGMLKKYWESNF